MIIKDKAELELYLMECGYTIGEAYELAQEAEIDLPVSKNELDGYLIDCGILPY